MTTVGGPGRPTRRRRENMPKKVWSFDKDQELTRLRVAEGRKVIVVAARMGMSVRAVSHRLAYLGIQKKDVGGKEFSRYKFSHLVRMLWYKGLTDDRIALVLNRKREVVVSARKKMGLPQDTKEEYFRRGDYVVVSNSLDHKLDGLVGVVRGEETCPRRGTVVNIAHRIYRPGKLPEEIEFKLELGMLTVLKSKVGYNYTVLPTEPVGEEPKQELKEITGRAFKRNSKDQRPRTGSQCPSCMSFEVVMTGKCETCLDCGGSVGGCS